jgi:hypothetical protein
MAVTWKKLAYEDDVVTKASYDAYSILAADTDNTPAAVVLSASNLIGRKSTGGIVALAKADILTIINVADGATANSKATGAEVDTGTDDTKFVTVKAINDSHNVPMVAPGDSGNFMVSNGTDWISSAAAPTAHALSAHTVATGNVDLGGNQATNLVLHTVANAAGLSGVTGVLGKIAWQTDVLAPYLCVTV